MQVNELQSEKKRTLKQKSQFCLSVNYIHYRFTHKCEEICKQCMHDLYMSSKKKSFFFPKTRTDHAVAHSGPEKQTI